MEEFNSYLIRKKKLRILFEYYHSNNHPAVAKKTGIDITITRKYTHDMLKRGLLKRDMNPQIRKSLKHKTFLATPLGRKVIEIGWKLLEAEKEALL